MKFTSHRRMAILFLIGLAACINQPAQPTLDVNAIYTQMVGTLSVSIQQTQDAVKASLATPTYFTPTFIPTLTASPTPIVSQTPFPTWTPAFIYVPPTATYIYYTNTPGGATSTVNPSMLGSGCNNLTFVRDVTVPAGTEFKPGDNFDKIWKVANSGSCSWKYQYHLIRISGDDYGAFTGPIGKVVEVNEWTELIVNIDAPNQPGTYKSYWRLADVDGKPFGPMLELSFVVK